MAEAGFSITGLSPAYSNGTGVQTQQQSFVVIGGHTQTAFLNMSLVAVWSLPEESWNFVTVDSPSISVDSRSGHSAVLSENGSSIVIYGGWVGDITQAASPQLAVLELGTGYGGTGDWKWTVPTIQPSGNGIFGHGATMLPGNVMMILGGYNISSSTTAKRATADGNQVTFFNATSMEFISNYTNPSYATYLDRTAANKSSGTSAEAKLGLGLGLGLCLAAVLAAIIVGCFYWRKLHRRQEYDREKTLRDLSGGGGSGSLYSNQNREMTQRGIFPWSNRGWNGGNQDPNSAVAGYEDIMSGVHAMGGEVPLPPKQITRKPLHSRTARGAYQQTSAFDFNTGAPAGRANNLGTAGPIHPIYEADEEEHTYGDNEVGIAIGEPAGPSSERYAAENCYSDPFQDSRQINYSSHIRTHSLISEPESPAVSREKEIQEWVADWAAADLLLHAQTKSHSHIGRISPTRRAQIIAATSISSVSGEEDSGRTESNLSERTDRSVAISSIGVSRSGSSSQGRSRSNSLRGFIAGMNPFSTHTSTVGTSTIMSPVFDVPRPISYVPPRSAGSSSSKSFNTARTSFPALQAEAENLLPRPVEEISSGEASPARSHVSYIDQRPGSPSKSKPSATALGRRRGQSGWLGSLRRVFVSDAEGSGNTSPERLGFERSKETSPVRVDNKGGSPPRRTVSAGATLWRRKQGKSDWDDSEDVFAPGHRSNTTFTGGDLSTPGMRSVSQTGAGLGIPEDDEEWDIERAVQNRVVQVMFTVPKEKLRVVNHDFDEDGSVISGNSLRSKKGSGKRSLKDLFMVPPEMLSLPASTGVLEAQEHEHEPDTEMTDAPLLSREEAEKIYSRDEEPAWAANVSTPRQDKGKGKEVELDRTPEVVTNSGRSSPNRKKNTKVLEMVDKMEGRHSPER